MTFQNFSGPVETLYWASRCLFTIVQAYISVPHAPLITWTKNIDGRAAAKNDDSHCEPM